ncbi:MAG: helix-turn-helix domain-containing protein [Atopobiaceae bacterium]|jgi:transcriptional regulator with XRE-family HTH domain|nr:helix-turn-helix domain-containing protein [Atopobiaceae bacterium]
MDRKEVGRRIRSWIVDSGKSQEQVAEEMGVSFGALKSWIYGNRTISLDQAVLIANYFQKPLDELACRRRAKDMAIVS